MVCANMVTAGNYVMAREQKFNYMLQVRSPGGGGAERAGDIRQFFCTCKHVRPEN